MKGSLRGWIKGKFGSEPVWWCVCIVLGLSNAATIAMLWHAHKTVYYVPSADRLTVASAEAFDVPEGDVSRFAEHFVTNYSGYHPQTVEAQMMYVRTLFSPGALAESPGLLNDLVKYSRNHDLSAQVQIVPGTTRVVEERTRWVVTMEAVVATYTRKRLFQLKRHECVLTILPGIISELTPDGLMVDRFDRRVLEVLYGEVE